MEFLGSLLSAGSSLLGGIFGRSSAEQIAAQNIAQQNAYAHNRIQWTVADAQKAGINPLAALGNATQSFSNIVGDNSLGEGIAKAGQDVGRAVTAATAQPSRADQLAEKLVEAKIANVNADTVRLQAAASSMATKLGQPATANVPFPTPDPRGPVINLVQRAYDPRTHEYVWIPSEKAASPLQTLAASPTNAALAGRALTEGLMGFDTGAVRGDVARSVSPDQWTTFQGAP